MRRWVARLVALVLVAVAASVAGGTVVAVAASRWSTSAGEAAIDKYEKWGGGWGCEFVGLWETTSVTSILHVDHNCSTGSTSDDVWVEFHVGDIDVSGGGGCVELTVATGNIDESDNQGVVRNAAASGTGCGEVTQLCYSYMADRMFGESIGWTDDECIAFPVGAPPVGEHEWYGTGAAGCVGFTPLEPWVSGARAVSVSGGWAWEISVTTSTQGYVWPTRFTLDGVSLKGKVALRVSGSSVTVIRGDGASTGTYPVGGGFSGWWAAAPGPEGRSVLLVRSATKTTPIGSTAADVSVTGVGYWFDNAGDGILNAPSSSGTAPRAFSTRPTVATINSTGANSYGGHHDPERCHFWWGSKVHTDTSGYADPAAPLASRSEDTPPPAGTGTGSTTPPTYDPPGAADPGDDGADDGTCEGASFTDPTTWGGAMTCMVGRLLVEVIRALEALIGAVAGIADAILDGLVALFIPSSFPDFTDIPLPIPAGWVPSIPSLGDGACGELVMPALDFGNMIGSVGPVVIADTCDPPWPTVRTFTYYGLLAALLVTVGNRALRAGMSALGVAVDSPGGDDDDR